MTDSIYSSTYVTLYHQLIITKTPRDALTYSFCVLEVGCLTSFHCSGFRVRKQRADSGGLGLGQLSSKTLTLKHSLLPLHVSVNPRLHFLLSLSVCFFSASVPLPSFPPEHLSLVDAYLSFSPPECFGGLKKKFFRVLFLMLTVYRNCVCTVCACVRASGLSAQANRSAVKLWQSAEKRRLAEKRVLFVKDNSTDAKSHTKRQEEHSQQVP